MDFYKVNLKYFSVVELIMFNINEFFSRKNNTTLIIAEAGVNHNGCISNAKKLIDMAVRCGANAIKFQKKNVDSDIQVIKIDENTSGEDKWDLPFGKNLLEHQDFLEFSQDKFRELKEYADSQGILFLASAWDEDSADFLIELGLPVLKIGSPDLTNFPLLEHVAKKNIPLILSTGMADLETVKEAYEILSFHNKNIAILQCTSCYPTLAKDVNLQVIKTYQTEFTRCLIGYSGHERGITASLGAVALGGRIVERHITLDQTMDGTEHIASLEEDEFSRLVQEIRVMEQCVGSPEKKKLACELDNLQTHSKSLVIKKSILKGEIISREHLSTVTGGSGVSPMKLYYVIGKKVNQNLEKGTVLVEDYLD
jgi:sialic acid synthase